MKRFTVAVVCLSGCVLGTACQAIVGIEDRSEAPFDDAGSSDGASTTATDGGSTGDTGAPCPPGATDCLDPDAAPPAGCPTDCLPPAPAGWVGPSATYDGAESGKPTDCPATYDQKEVEAHVGMTAPAATCDCGTAVVTGRKCVADVVLFSQAGCNGTPTLEGTASSGTGCLTTVTSGKPAYRVETPTLVPGACTFPNAKTTLPPPTFDKVQVSCGAAQAKACETRADCVATPAPAQPFTRLCIHKDGDVPCPSQDYAKRFVAHKKVDDTRACTACTATPTGGSCGTSWGNRASAAMCVNVPAPNDKTVNTCYSYPGVGTVVDIGATGPSSATCTPAGGAPSGTATSEDPVTFCCNR